MLSGTLAFGQVKYHLNYTALPATLLAGLVKSSYIHVMEHGVTNWHNNATKQKKKLNESSDTYQKYVAGVALMVLTCKSVAILIYQMISTSCWKPTKNLFVYHSQYMNIRLGTVH